MDRQQRDPVQRRVVAAVRAALRAAHLPTGALVMVAVSGGPDSLCLLHAVAWLAPRLGLRVHAAHLDHGLRGAAGAADAAFVADVCRRMGVACTTERRSVPDYRAAAGVSSVEAAARAVRYAFLRDTAAATGATAVATGHTRDDQAETVLLHLVRGTGTGGLAGMRGDATLPVPGGGSLRVLRPLLGVARADTHAYCATVGLAPRQDETNVSEEFTRNRIRGRLLPELRSLNPRAVEALAQLADQARLDEDYWDAEVARLLPTLCRPALGGLSLDRGALRAQRPALVARLLRAAAAQVAPAAPLTADHTAALGHLATGPAGRQWQLPGASVAAFTTREALVLLPRLPDLGPAPTPSVLEVPGSAAWGHWRVTAQVATAGDAAARGPWQALAAAPGGSLVVRSRRPGDRYAPAGLATAKKLQDLLVDAGALQLVRDHLPVFEAPPGHVAWVAGLRGPAQPPRGQVLLTVAPLTPQLCEILRLWKGHPYNDVAQQPGHT